MGHLFYLVGPPGSGKRTVGKALARLTGAALLDNHSWNDPIFQAFGLDGAAPVPERAKALAGQMRQLTLQAVEEAPAGVGHILTNYLSEQAGEQDAFEAVRALAARRQVHFVPVWLTCPLPGLERRMPLPERLERRKLRDPVQLRHLMQTAGNLPAPPDALVLDTFTLGPEEAAQRIVAFAGG